MGCEINRTEGEGIERMGDIHAVKAVESNVDIVKKVKELIIQVHRTDMQPEELAEDLSNLDSIQTIELVVKLEEAFGVMIDVDELAAENYESVSRIVKLIMDKLEGPK